MKQILFIDDTNNSLKKTSAAAHALETTGLFEITRLERSQFQFSDVRTERVYEGLIYECSRIDREEVLFLRGLSAVVENEAAILAIADEISLFAYSKVDFLKNVVCLQKPFQDETLTALFKRLVFDPTFKPPRCPRFITNEPVRMIVLSTGLMIPTKMKNYSAGGAFLEYRGISLKVGDPIQLNLSKNDSSGGPAQDYKVLAKVVWIRGGNSESKSLRGVGIQFTEQLG